MNKSNLEIEESLYILESIINQGNIKIFEEAEFYDLAKWLEKNIEYREIPIFSHSIWLLSAYSTNLFEIVKEMPLVIVGNKYVAFENELYNNKVYADILEERLVSEKQNFEKATYELRCKIKPNSIILSLDKLTRLMLNVDCLSQHILIKNNHRALINKLESIKKDKKTLIQKKIKDKNELIHQILF